MAERQVAHQTTKEKTESIKNKFRVKSIKNKFKLLNYISLKYLKRKFINRYKIEGDFYSA